MVTEHGESGRAEREAGPLSLWASRSVRLSSSDVPESFVATRIVPGWLLSTGCLNAGFLDGYSRALNNLIVC